MNKVYWSKSFKNNIYLNHFWNKNSFNVSSFTELFIKSLKTQHLNLNVNEFIVFIKSCDNLYYTT